MKYDPKIKDLKPEIVRKWIAALRSGQYRQGIGAARAAFSEEPSDGYQYCCLGVLADVCVREGLLTEEQAFVHIVTTSSILNGVIGLEGPVLGGELGVTSDNPEHGNQTFWTMNDIDRLSFPEIADIIEKELNQ